MTTQITPGEVVECDSIFSKSIYSDGVTKRGDPNNYQDRLRTYRRDPYPWPLLRPCPEDLAKAGFIYTGQGTQVHCLSCGIYVEDWNDPRIDPVRKHYICNRGCEFLLKHCAQRVRDIYIGSRYSDASLRLSSFTNWPRSAPVPSDLASAGFYYTGEGSKVCCFSCTIAYADWKPADIPVLIHRQLNPSCEFLAELFSEKNIASFPTTCAPDAAMRLPDYSSPELRLMSFRHKQWKNDVVTKEELADAGLYLVELPDVVRCYSCGVELRDWVPGDTAMGKHEKKSPQCPFVRQHQLVGPTFKYTVSIDTTNSSGLSSDLQKQKPVYGEGLFPVEQYRRHSDQGIYLPPTYLGQMGLGQTISVPPSYARSNSFPKQTHNLELPAGSVLCSEDVKADSPSPRWMLDAGVDIRLPPSLDLRRRPPSSMASYTVEPPKSVPRSMVRPVSFLPTPALSYLTTPPSPSSLSVTPLSQSSFSVTPPSPLDTHNAPLYSRVQSPPASPSRVSSNSTSYDDSKLCQICFEKPLGMVFTPCGHVCTCESCAVKVSNCPLCRRSIEKSFRFFLP